MIRSGKHYPVGSKFSRRRAARIGWPHLPRREDAAASPSAGAGLVSSVWHRHSDSMRQLLRHWSAFARPHIRGSDLIGRRRSALRFYLVRGRPTRGEGWHIPCSL